MQKYLVPKKVKFTIWHPSKNYRGCKERAEKYNPQPRTETHILQSADKKIKNYTYIPYIQNHKER